MNRCTDSEAWFPLSAAQRSRCFLYELDPASQGSHNDVFAARVHGPIASKLLAKALRQIITIHPMLRTRFRMGDEEPEQCIVPPGEVPVSCWNAAGLSDEALQQRVSRDGLEPFDLSQSPLIRANLYQRGAHETVIALVFDHIAGDGWSYWQILHELGLLLSGEPGSDDIAEGKASYRDYIAWQREWLTTSAADAQRSYWEKNLGSETAILQLPTDRPRPLRAGSHRGVATVTLDAAFTEQLHRFAREQSGTLCTILLGAYHVLLHRYAMQNEVVVGCAMPGRTRPEWDRVVGDFVNPIAIRGRFDGGQTVADALRAVRNTAFRGMANQDYPFSKVVERCHSSGQSAEHPLFQTMFVFQKVRHGTELRALWSLTGCRTPIKWGGVELTPFPAHQSGGNPAIGLVLEVLELEQGVRCDFRFDCDLFDSETVERFAGYFTTLLSAMVLDQSQWISQLPLLSVAQHHQLLVEFNATEADYPSNRLIHELFEEQAARSPEATALVYEKERLSYGELNHRANQVAHYLVGLGIRPDDRVAICMERSLEMVVGVLGILKAGGAYVPLDPSYPEERITYMLDDSGPRALLTQTALRDSFPKFKSHLLLLDGADDLSRLAQQSRENPDPLEIGLNGRHLAYVIYTSGSTGAPKGVMIEHRSVVNLWSELEGRVFGARSDQARIGLNAGLSFDASVQSVTQLLSGRCVVIIPQHVRGDGAALCRFLADQEVDVLDCTPAQLELMLAEGLLERASYQLKSILVGGEAIAAKTWEQLSRSSSTRFFNVYGPTECTVDATIGLVEAGGTQPHIGRPVANTQIYILDGRLQPVPLGVSGEIYIGGVGVARGYLNRPELTAERFIIDPFSSEPGARLYKTGDLGRWLPDGKIEYLGRNDFQVKIRGYRIELGEIEARLAACVGVRQAVVIAREDSPGEKRLVAYVVAQAGVELSAAVLRGELSKALAEYMVPSAFVSLEALPLTSNGKLDRQALPAPDQSAIVARAYEAPVGELEVAIGEVWQELLGLERVGRHDHFFELGGHSLLAGQVVSRLRQRLGVEVELRELFTQPILGEFAKVVAQAGQGAQPPLLPADRTGPLPLSWAQQRLWFLDRLDHAAGAAYHIPAALRLSGKLNQEALQAALDRIVARHESLRTAFVSVEGTPIQMVAPAEIGFALRHRDLSSLEGSAQEAAVGELAAAEGSQSFDLATGPLIRGQLLHLGQDEHVLLVTQHHIISDGWSFGVLMRELSALYSALSQGEPDPLPQLTIQYADYAVWQRQWLEGEVLQRQIDFWREHLGGAPALLELPTDRPRPAEQSYKGSSVPVTLPAELTAGLRALSQRHGTTLFMTLLGGWSVLLSRLSGQADVVIGTPVANRQRSEIESLIGFFVNTLALRVRLEEDPSVAQLLEQIKATTLGAYAHQDLPFEQVVEALQPERSLSHSALFQAMLVLNNLPSAGALTLPGLRLALMETPQVTTHFDLTLSLTDSGGVLAGGIEYATDLFDASTVERMMGYFVTLLSAMVEDQTQSISQLPLLSAAQRHQLLVEFNDTRTNYPRNAFIDELFEEQARRTPSAVAVVLGDTQLSYDELNRRANRLARRLQELGVGREVPVGILMDRSLEMVTSLLGVLKARGAYVPLDPTYPADRLLFIINDTGTPVILTQTRFKNYCLEVAAKVLCLDADQFTEEDDTNFVGEGRAEDLAYVMYTSGSTGTPKGVAVTHRNVVRLVKGTDYASFSPDETFLQLAPMSFDASTLEIWGALLNGGKLVVMPPAQPSLEDIGSAIDEHGVTTLWLTSGLFNAMVDERLDDLRPLRQLLAGGDVLSVPHVRKALRELTSTRLINGYGPTESTTFACCHTIEPDVPLDSSIPIGRPIANTTAYILDSKLHPVPIGVTGQLFIGGDGLGRGYWQRPELTAKKFINDPFGSEPDARLYETGDLGRWLPDGNIEYLGRNDFQVKIRGFRIELEEIEARLRGCAGVQDARVISKEYRPQDARLIAYIIPSPECASPISEMSLRKGAASGATEEPISQKTLIRDLRASLAQQMPEFMIPAAFVFLPQIPLTANGKLDRAALPFPDEFAIIRRGYEAPAGDVEPVIARIWQELLGVDRVGRQDHFFELGGHSLMLITLIERLRQQGLNTNVRSIFIAPTLEALAASVLKHKSLASSVIVPPNLIPPQFGMALRETHEEFRI